VNSPFLPQNIFWDPEGKVIESEWRCLWERSLYLGWVLLNESVQSKEDFCRQLEDLRQEVKGHLFQGEPAVERQPEPVQGETAVEDRAIHDILVKIINRRQAGNEEEKEELRETVVLSARGSSQAKRVEEKKEEEEELKETVILSTRPLLKETRVKEDLPETVILSASQSGKGVGPPLEAEQLRGGKKAIKEPSKDEFLAETVILGPRKAPEKKKDKTNE